MFAYNKYLVCFIQPTVLTVKISHFTLHSCNLLINIVLLHTYNIKNQELNLKFKKGKFGVAKNTWISRTWLKTALEKAGVVWKLLATQPRMTRKLTWFPSGLWLMSMYVTRDLLSQSWICISGKRYNVLF